MNQEQWERVAPQRRIEAAQLKALFPPELQAATVESCRLLSGGLSQTKYRIDLRLGDYAPASAYVVSVFDREPAASRREEGIFQRLREAVPLAALVSCDHSPQNAVGAAYTINRWVEGALLAEVLAGGGTQQESLGEAVGKVAAAIHRQTFTSAADFSMGLALDYQPEGAAATFQYYLELLLQDSLVLSRAGRARTTALREHLRPLSARLAAWPASFYLVHGDFKGWNLLVQLGPRPEVSAVLDWEYTHAGHPVSDFGNMVRGLAPDTAFAQGFAKAYRAAGAFLPDDWFALARSCDSLALLEFLSRPGERPRLFRSILKQLDELLLI